MTIDSVPTIDDIPENERTPLVRILIDIIQHQQNLM